MEMIQDKFKGCLIGGASGDALGYTVEFLKYEQIQSLYGKKGITKYTLTDNVALVSDDTQMTLFTANGLPRGITKQVSGFSEKKQMNMGYFKGFTHKSLVRQSNRHKAEISSYVYADRNIQISHKDSFLIGIHSISMNTQPSM